MDSKMKKLIINNKYCLYKKVTILLIVCVSTVRLCLNLTVGTIHTINEQFLTHKPLSKRSGCIL